MLAIAPFVRQCQKVWLLLEEKRIPFKVSKINMRSYGEKPAWFTNLVPG